jgi:ribosomal protein L30E
MANLVAEIKKLLKENKLVIGKDEVMKGLRQGKFAKIYFASNCPASLKEDATHYASIAGVELVEAGLQNVELGDVCKKPFSIAVIGLLK